jgi:hypothetical protein
MVFWEVILILWKGYEWFSQRKIGSTVFEFSGFGFTVVHLFKHNRYDNQTLSEYKASSILFATKS